MRVYTRDPSETVPLVLLKAILATVQVRLITGAEFFTSGTLMNTLLFCFSFSSPHSHQRAVYNVITASWITRLHRWVLLEVCYGCGELDWKNDLLAGSMYEACFFK